MKLVEVITVKSLSIIGTAVALLSGCLASSPTAIAGAAKLVDPDTWYQCYTTHRELVLILPVGDDVEGVTLHGDLIQAAYVRNGLDQYWILGDDIHIKLEPDLRAIYMDGGRITSMFRCEKKVK